MLLYTYLCELTFVSFVVLNSPFLFVNNSSALKLSLLNPPSQTRCCFIQNSINDDLIVSRLLNSIRSPSCACFSSLVFFNLRGHAGFAISEGEVALEPVELGDRIEFTVSFVMTDGGGLGVGIRRRLWQFPPAVDDGKITTSRLAALRVTDKLGVVVLFHKLTIEQLSLPIRFVFLFLLLKFLLLRPEQAIMLCNC